MFAPPHIVEKLLSGPNAAGKTLKRELRARHATVAS